MTQSPGEDKDKTSQAGPEPTPEPAVAESTAEPAAQPTAENGASPEAADASTAAPDSVDLEQALAEARAKADENWERYMRATAEQDNIRKRSAREMEQARKFAVERLAKDLLAVLDSLDLGLKSAQGDAAAEAGPLLEGVTLTRKMFAETLTRHGVTEMNPEGAVFDPGLHEAMTAVPTADAPPNTILEVVQKGYLLNERVLRPAMVVVAQAPAAPAAE